MTLTLNPLIKIEPVDGGGLAVILRDGPRRDECAVDDPRFAAWLLGLRTARDGADAASRLSSLLGIELDDACRAVAALVERQILVEERRCRRLPPEMTDGWRDALDFQLAVKDLGFESTDESDQSHPRWRAAQAAAMVKGLDEPSPSPFHERVGPVRTLPRSRTAIDARRFGDVARTAPTLARTEGPIPFAIFAELLEHAFGMTFEVADWDGWGQHVFRTTPSLGARHPVEVYPVVLDVEGVKPGVYHYSLRRHALVELHLGDVRDVVGNLLGREVRGCALLFTVRFARYMWKYRDSRYYAMALLEVGHLLGTEAHVARALGLANEHVLALSARRAGELLGIRDDLEESVMAAAVVTPGRNAT